MDQTSPDYNKFKQMINLFHELLMSQRFQNFMKNHPDETTRYDEVKSLSNTLKDAGDIDENIARVFLYNFRALVTKVFPAGDEESKVEKATYTDGAQDAELTLNNLINSAGNYESNMSISQFRKKKLESPASRMRSFAMMFILVLIILGLIFLSGKLNRDLYPFLIFIFMVSFPLLVVFRRNIYNILPIKVQSIDELSKVEKQVVKHNNSKMTKDMTRIGGIAFLNIFSILMLVTQGKKFMGIMLAAMSSIVAGVLVFDIKAP